MKTIFVDQITERQVVESTFLVRDKITAMAKNGKPYMTLKLMDRSGEVEGRIWDRVDQLSAQFEKNDFIQLFAKASVYLGKMQLVVQDLKKVPEESVDLGDFLPVSKRAQEDMRQELDGLLDSLTDPHISALLRSFLMIPISSTATEKLPPQRECTMFTLEDSLSILLRFPLWLAMWRRVIRKLIGICCSAERCCMMSVRSPNYRMIAPSIILTKESCWAILLSASR